LSVCSPCSGGERDNQRPVRDAVRPRGIENFRDFGDFAIFGGRRVRRGRLLRSANPAHATAADVKSLTDLRLQVVVDLRRRTERIAAPSHLAERVGASVIDCDRGDRGASPHLEFLQQGDLSGPAVEAYLLDYYRNAFFEPRHQELFARAFKALETIDGAILIHCSGGKDRTGLLAALIRTALGGAWDETLSDFRLTNRFTMTPGKIAAARSTLENLLGQPPGEAALKAFIGVWPHHLEAAFISLKLRRGSVQAYLNSLGVDRTQRSRLVDRFAT
jgi:protein tyrosine/serine phosphatase